MIALEIFSIKGKKFALEFVERKPRLHIGSLFREPVGKFCFGSGNFFEHISVTGSVGFEFINIVFQQGAGVTGFDGFLQIGGVFVKLHFVHPRRAFAPHEKEANTECGIFAAVENAAFVTLPLIAPVCRSALFYIVEKRSELLGGPIKIAVVPDIHPDHAAVGASDVFALAFEKRYIVGIGLDFDHLIYAGIVPEFGILESY